MQSSTITQNTINIFSSQMSILMHTARKTKLHSEGNIKILFLYLSLTFLIYRHEAENSVCIWGMGEKVGCIKQTAQLFSTWHGYYFEYKYFVFCLIFLKKDFT